MTARGRPPVAANDGFIDARRDDSGLAVRQLWSGPSGRYGPQCIAMHCDPLRPAGSLDCWPNSRHLHDRLNSSDASPDSCALDGRTTSAASNSYPPLVLPV